MTLVIALSGVSYVTLRLPAVQRWMGRTVASVLAAEIGSPVAIDRVDASLPLRPVLDGVTLVDQRGDTLLKAARMATRLRFMPLLSGRVSLAHIQLYGPDVWLRKDSCGRLNCQYIIDLLSAGDGGGDGTDLDIGTIILRRGRLSLDSLQLSDIAATVYGLRVEKKHVQAHLRDFHLDASMPRTPRVEVDNLTARLDMDTVGGCLSRVAMSLQGLRMAVDSVRWMQDFASWRLSGGRAYADLAALAARKIGLDRNAAILEYVPYMEATFALSGSADTLRTDVLAVEGPDFRADADAVVRFSPLSARLEAFLLDWRRGEHVTVDASGAYSAEHSALRAQVATGMASATVDATLDDNDRWQMDCRTNRFRPSLLAGYLDNTGTLAGTLGDSATVTLNLRGAGRLRLGSMRVEGTAACSSRPLVCDIGGTYAYSVVSGTDVQVAGNIARVRPSAFGLDGRLARNAYSAGVQANVALPPRGKAEDAIGNVALKGLTVLDDTLHRGQLMSHLVVDVSPTADDNRRLSVFSDFLNLHTLVSGRVSDLVASVREKAGGVLPSLVPSGPGVPGLLVRKQVPQSACEQPSTLNTPNSTLQTRLVANAQLWDTRLLNYLADTDIDILDTMQLHLEVDSVVRLAVQTDSMRYGGERLTGVEVDGRLTADRLSLNAGLGRRMKENTAMIALRAGAADDTIGTRVDWTVLPRARRQHTDTVANRGTLDVGLDLGDTLHIAIRPSEVVLNKTPWNVGRGDIRLLPGGALDIGRASFESGDRYLRLRGRMSDNPADTLVALLKDVNLGYIFDMINFDEVELDGDASGRILATGLTSNPKARGSLLVTNFSFNSALLGDMNLQARWDTKAGQLDLDGHITGPPVGQTETPVFGDYTPVNTTIRGRVNPGKSNPRSGLDLDIQAQGFNLGFLNYWTDDIFSWLEGCMSGHVRLYGPFNALDLEGRVAIDHCAVAVPSLGNIVFRAGGDSVTVRPGEFRLHDLELYDQHAWRRGADHCAIVNGALTHNHFKRMAYDFRAKADNMLGYDTRDFGDEVFYGTAFITGDVRLEGGPGRLNVDVDNGVTMPGSVLVYNSSSPESVSSGNFITYVSNLNAASTSSRQSQAVLPAYVGGTDMNLRFNVRVTPDATLRVLMDQRTGDIIELHGNAPITASYYNKGAFRMYGTYEVQRGRYSMTIQNILPKTFTFVEGGTITFPGAPMSATLNMQAAYEVRASLNDLAATTTFSSARTRVNCLMNLTGTVSSPQVTFDFDLPNASQDEVAMVKSLVSTDEERNLQAVYLLGLGTFYVQDNATAETRGNMAVNSFLSSTLSSQINSVLGGVIGSHNWSFGTNISTGQMGWSEVQAEGSLSGRLFNDRLLINGSFGYRDGGTNPAQTGFVGDFDVQWLLTRNGTVSLKAYSQTTDRYFTKSALTTQGLGLVLKKDFLNIRDLLGVKR